VRQLFFKNFLQQKHDFLESELHVDNIGRKSKAPKNKGVFAVQARIAGHQCAAAQPTSYLYGGAAAPPYRVHGCDVRPILELSMNLKIVQLEINDLGNPSVGGNDE